MSLRRYATVVTFTPARRLFNFSVRCPVTPVRDRVHDYFLSIDFMPNFSNHLDNKRQRQGLEGRRVLNTCFKYFFRLVRHSCDSPTIRLQLVLARFHFTLHCQREFNYSPTSTNNPTMGAAGGGGISSHRKDLNKTATASLL